MKKISILFFVIFLVVSMILIGYLSFRFSDKINGYKTKLQENEEFVRIVKFRMNQLIEDMDTELDKKKIKNLLLSDLPSKELLVSEKITDTFETRELKSKHNKIIMDIINAAREILDTKISQLNEELKKRNMELINKNSELEDKIKEIEKYKEEIEEIKQKNLELEKIKEELSNKIKGLEVVVENGKVKVTYKGDLLFALGSRRIKKEGKKILDQIAPEILKNIDKYDIFIAGHTDNIPVKKENTKFESNWDLSSYRAIEVAKYLVKRGIPPESITAAGYGKYRPLVKNDSEKNRSKNRRVEIYLIPKIIKR